MTRSMTLAGLPRAGANSKPHRYKQNVQKMKDLPKHGFQMENSVKISDEKKRTETLFSTFQKNPMEHKDSERVS